ncbi:MAG TPA: hypothetical protein VJI69_09335 [Bacteroidia bacterium]|nr:hypothetical protein [Bacteroidia bacterium]
MPITSKSELHSKPGSLYFANPVTKTITAVENVLGEHPVWLMPRSTDKPENYSFVFTRESLMDGKKLDSSSWYFFLGEFDEHIKQIKSHVSKLKLKNVVFRKH